MFASNGATVNFCSNLENDLQDIKSVVTKENITNAMEISDNEKVYNKTDLSNLKVTVGIDEDLQMILEMDPSIVDLVRFSLQTLNYLTNFKSILWLFALKVSITRIPSKIVQDHL